MIRNPNEMSYMDDLRELTQDAQDQWEAVTVLVTFDDGSQTRIMVGDDEDIRGALAALADDTGLDVANYSLPDYC